MGCDSGRGIVVAPLFRGIQPHFSLTAAKRVLSVVALAFMGAAGYVLAAPSTVEATPCVFGNLDTYILLGSTGCTIDDKTFSNFLYNSDSGGGGVAVPSSAVSVTPVPAPGNPGLTFAGPWSVTGPLTGPPHDASTRANIVFDVSTTSGAALIEDASVSVVQGGTGLFGTDVDEELCLGVSYSSCIVVTPHVRLTVQNVSGSDSATFTPESIVSADSLLVGAVAANGAGNSATVSSVTVQFSEVPEPATMALFGTGLLGFLGPRLLRRRR